MRYQSILKTIGNTPIVELRRYSTHQNVKIFAKLEGSNPSGSIKDRVALYMFQDAKKRGILNTHPTLIEATSGNTGISLAMIAAVYGYHFLAVMPDNVSEERRKFIRAYGGDILLTDGNKGTNGSIEIATDFLKNKNGKFYMLHQYENFMNIFAHYKTTGQEIIQQLPMVTHFVAGMGTGGTLMGVGKRLKEFKQNIRVIGIEPEVGSKIQGLRNMNVYTPPIFDTRLVDTTLHIKDDEFAFTLARDLNIKEGISVGISSGAALWGAIELSKTIQKGVIVTVFPDRGDRYTSTPLFQ